MGKGDFIKSPPFIVMPEIEKGAFPGVPRDKPLIRNSPRAVGPELLALAG